MGKNPRKKKNGRHLLAVHHSVITQQHQAFKKSHVATSKYSSVLFEEYIDFSEFKEEHVWRERRGDCFTSALLCADLIRISTVALNYTKSYNESNY